MQRLKIDMLKFTAAKRFTAKDGTEHVAIPLAANNIFIGEKGLYCEISLLENRDGTDQYGQDGFATLDLGKQRREAGEKGAVLGNWKHIGQPQARAATPPSRTATADASDEDFEDQIPF